MRMARRVSIYDLRRRVPRGYGGVEPRGTVWIRLHTDSETGAPSKAERAWGQTVEAWEARLAGDTDDAEARHAAARELARVRGFRYLRQEPGPAPPLGKPPARRRLATSSPSSATRIWQASPATTCWTSALREEIDLIAQLKIFDQVYLFSQGGRPNDNMVLVYYVFQRAFQQDQGGRAAAVAVTLFVLVVVVSVLQFQLLRMAGDRK